jgi:hypothetical protein
MNSFTQLVQNVKAANWQGAGQVFKEIMQQKVADRLDVERRTIFKEDSSEAYKKYFDSMLKKWNVSSPADIPADKKDDFFKAVDAGYEAKNEVTDDEAEGKALLDEPYPKEVDEDDDKGEWRGGALPYGRPDDPPHPEDE